MSIHKECGAQIKWAKRADDLDRYGQPLEFHGFYYIIDESGAAIEVTCYDIHVCDPEQMKKYQERLASINEIAEIKEDSTLFKMSPSAAYEAAREVRRADTWKVALKVDCPTCEVKAKKKCRNLSKGKNYNKITKNPDPLRIEAGMALK